MKIALCFSGQARSFEKGYEFYKKNLFDYYDVDVYIHTWRFDKERKLLELFRPVSYEFENYPFGDFDTRYTNTPNPQKHPPRTTYRMYYSVYKSSQLIYKKYDWVIKSRTDYALNVVIPFKELDNSKLYIPNCRMVPQRDFGNDQFAFSSQDNMMKYMSTFLNLDKYYNEGSQFNGEDLMRANLYEHNLHGENLVYVNMNNHFPPGPHNGSWHSLIRDDYETWTNP